MGGPHAHPLTLLDLARAEDDARWPIAVAWEREEARRTYAARCAVAEAQELAEQAGPPGEHGVPLPTVHQSAATDLASVGDKVAAQWLTDPEEAATVLRGLVASGELAADDVLDEAVDSAVLPGLLALQEVRAASDPSTAAELCLSAVPHIALAVTLASADLDRSRSALASARVSGSAFRSAAEDSPPSCPWTMAANCRGRYSEESSVPTCLWSRPTRAVGISAVGDVGSSAGRGKEWRPIGEGDVWLVGPAPLVRVRPQAGGLLGLRVLIASDPAG
ncbi:hypothetical protein ACIQWV_38185 [Streptomyces sp. NPDC098085]|uniref:hypothetical protein n=1 Tax=Streptomyces sp. NPDC098085 TaxID=3366094 RepID=UPI00382B5FC4